MNDFPAIVLDHPAQGRYIARLPGLICPAMEIL